MKFPFALRATAMLAMLMAGAPGHCITNDDLQQRHRIGRGGDLLPGRCLLARCHTEPGQRSTAREAPAPPANDAWFSFIATSAHTVIMVQSDTANDAVVEVLNGSCGSLATVDCADATLLGGEESLLLNTTAGVTYYVRTYWWDYGSTPASLDFAICALEGAASPGERSLRRRAAADIGGRNFAHLQRHHRGCRYHW
jgi:hypothetical protein